jgi:hypothetical protein
MPRPATRGVRRSIPAAAAPDLTRTGMTRLVTVSPRPRPSSAAAAPARCPGGMPGGRAARWPPAAEIRAADRCWRSNWPCGAWPTGRSRWLDRPPAAASSRPLLQRLGALDGPGGRPRSAGGWAASAPIPRPDDAGASRPTPDRLPHRGLVSSATRWPGAVPCRLGRASGRHAACASTRSPATCPRPVSADAGAGGTTGPGTLLPWLS